MDSLQTIGIQITMNYSVIDNQENDGPQSTSHPQQTSQPLNRLPRGQRPTEHRTQGLPGSPGTGPNRTGRGEGPPGSAADNGHQDNPGQTQRQ